jgi:hypothetical protein
MPVWTVQLANGEDELVNAGMLVTDSGALVAFTEEGVMVLAWAPGEWRTVRYVTRPDGAPPRRTRVLVGVPDG